MDIMDNSRLITPKLRFKLKRKSESEPNPNPNPAAISVPVPISIPKPNPNPNRNHIPVPIADHNPYPDSSKEMTSNPPLRWHPPKPPTRNPRHRRKLILSPSSFSDEDEAPNKAITKQSSSHHTALKSVNDIKGNDLAGHEAPKKKIIIKPPSSRPTPLNTVQDNKWKSLAEAPKKITTKPPSSHPTILTTVEDNIGKGLADPDPVPGYTEFVTYQSPEEYGAWSLMMLARHGWSWTNKKKKKGGSATVTVDDNGKVVLSVTRKSRAQQQHVCSTCGEVFQSRLLLNGHRETHQQVASGYDKGNCRNQMAF